MYTEKISICEKRARGIVSGKVSGNHCLCPRWSIGEIVSGNSDDIALINTKDDRLMIKENNSLRHSVTKGKQAK